MQEAPCGLATAANPFEFDQFIERVDEPYWATRQVQTRPVLPERRVFTRIHGRVSAILSKAKLPSLSHLNDGKLSLNSLTSFYLFENNFLLYKRLGAFSTTAYSHLCCLCWPVWFGWCRRRVPGASEYRRCLSFIQWHCFVLSLFTAFNWTHWSCLNTKKSAWFDTRCLFYTWQPKYLWLRTHLYILTN